MVIFLNRKFKVNVFKFEVIPSITLNMQRFRDYEYALTNNLLPIITKGNLSFMLQGLQSLSKSIEIPIELKASIIESFSSKFGRECFVEALSQIKMSISVNESSLKAIGDIVNNFLNSMFAYKDNNQLSLFSVLEFSRKIHFIKENKRYSLFEHIKENGVWQDSSRWRQMIRYLVVDKISKHDVCLLYTSPSPRDS